MQGDVETVNKCAPRVLVLKDDRGNSRSQSSSGSCLPIARVALTAKGKEEGNLFMKQKHPFGACEFLLEILSSMEGIKKRPPRTTLAVP